MKMKNFSRIKSKLKNLMLNTFDKNVHINFRHDSNYICCVHQNINSLTSTFPAFAGYVYVYLDLDEVGESILSFDYEQDEDIYNDHNNIVADRIEVITPITNAFNDYVAKTTSMLLYLATLD